MLRRIEYTARAEQELEEVIEYLVSYAPKLANRFAERYDALILRVREFPESASEISPGIRRAVIPGTDYLVFYSPGADTVRIVALANGRRYPRRWMPL
ncbi:MAG TPA: type II toxin-antitoxin system RelE/ParE family toxin [Tepidiformaceae bacterium]|nr:type II toxin-antitoxin system RelE/ParE family toxin [Tepidiformaceae bacterium]HMO95812.1 type II toxin-antitoxin system RelE/ParE family toxin [Tepidiformaceae bacterium]